MAVRSPLNISNYALGVTVGVVVVALGGLLLASRTQPHQPTITRPITLYFPSKSTKDRAGCPQLVAQQVNVVGEIPNTPLDRTRWVLDLLKNGPGGEVKGQKLYTAVPKSLTVRAATEMIQTLVIDLDSSADQVGNVDCVKEVLGNQISKTLKQFANTPQRIQLTVAGEYDLQFERPLPFIP